jgi:hypothetical protein
VASISSAFQITALHVALIVAGDEEGKDALIANRREQRLMRPD